MDELLDFAPPDQLVQPADASHLQDFSPVLVLLVDREKNGVRLELAHVQRVFRWGIAQQKPRREGQQTENGQEVGGGNQRPVREVQEAVAGVNEDRGVVAVLQQQKRVRLVVFLEVGDGLLVGKGEGSDGQVPRRDLPHLRFQPDQIVAGDRVQAVEIVEVALPQGVPDDEAAPGEHLRGGHGKQERERAAVDCQALAAAELHRFDGAVDRELRAEVDHLVVHQHGNQREGGSREERIGSGFSRRVPAGNSLAWPPGNVTRTFKPSP